MNDILKGRYIPGDSFLHRRNGTAKLLAFFMILAAVLTTDSVPGYLLIAAVSAAAAAMSEMRPTKTLGQVRHLRLFFLMLFLMNAFFYEDGQAGGLVLWSWGIVHLSVPGMIQGTHVVLRILFLMVFCNVLIRTTPPVQITTAIETLIAPLRLIRVPTAEVAMILSVALQFIPVFAQEADLIEKAQTARGAKFESERLRDRAASVVPLLVPIFLSAFRRADDLATAMEARGYGHRQTNGRGRSQRAAVQLPDVCLFLFSCLFFLVQAAR